MTAGELADIVLQARDRLRAWDGKSAAHDIAAAVRYMLAPLMTAELSADARRKLDEVIKQLDRFTGRKITPRQRDALDTLMLGLWIRVELAANGST